jgi:RimJ/RimL family protein N-acetyltransferase
VAITAAQNEPSQGLMKRLGMARRQELDFVDERFPADGPVNPQVVFAIDAADWPAARNAALG